MASCSCLKLGHEIGLHRTKIQNIYDGEEYEVKICVTGGPRHTASIHVQWNKASNLFIRLEIYTETSVTAFYQRHLTVHNGKHVSAVVCLSHLSCNFLHIGIMPYKSLTNCAKTLATNSSKEPIEERIKNDKVFVGNKTMELSSDMKCLLDSGYLSDVVVTDGTNKIEAHKLILSSRSSVFAAAFRHSMKENLDNSITIQDISLEALKTLLYFIYTGTVSISDKKMAFELYVAADKYDVKDLRSICSEILKDVTLDNVLEVVTLADLHQDSDLKQSAIGFIDRNYLQIKTLEVWGNFLICHKDLALEILQKIVDYAK